VPTVAELTALYGNFMLGPQPGPGVCEGCFDLTDGTFRRCYRCGHSGPWIDAMAPISYSVAHEQLHHALAGYKRLPSAVAHRLEIELAAVLWRHLAAHERCLAQAAGTHGFELVTTVPSSSGERDAVHPLHRIAGRLAGPTRSRHERLLRRTGTSVAPREFNAHKYEAVAELAGRSVLLIDDTWTTGANARSAAAALKMAGAGAVAALVIGRHVNRDWQRNDRLLQALESPFDWARCALDH
jgi:predicted amidophosphoribosyltransferase